MVTRVRQIPVTTRQVHGGTAGMRSSQKVSPQVQINRVHGQARAQLGTALLPQSLGRDHSTRLVLDRPVGPWAGGVVEVPGEAGQGH